MAACVFLALAGIAGGIGWGVRDRTAREDEIALERSAREKSLDKEAERAVNEAGLLIHEGKWSEALALIQRTKQLLATAGRQPDDFSAALQELDKDVEMARRLEQIHSQPGPQEENIHNGRASDTAYARAFQDYGIDLAVLPVAEAAERMRGRSIRLELARAVDFWSSLRLYQSKGPPDWTQLLEVAKLADPDPWRNRLRDAFQRHDRKALEVLAASADVPSLSPTTLHLLGRALYRLGNSEQAIHFLRQAQRLYPADLWLNEVLASICWQPHQLDDALRFYTAALALRPLDPYLTLQVAGVLRRKGSYAEAVAQYSKVLQLKPNDLDALNGRGDVYSKLGKWDKEFADFTKIVELGS